MLKLMTLVIILVAASVGYAEDASFKNSNCRSISSVLKGPSGEPGRTSHNLGDDKSKDRLPGAAGDLQKQDCLTSLLTGLVSEITDPNTNLTTIRDEGVIQFSEPGRKGEYTSCHYLIEPNQHVSDLLLQEEGVKPHETGMNFYPFMQQIRQEADRLVKVSCDAVS